MKHDNFDDFRAEIRELKRRIEWLEGRSPLNSSSIDSGPGLAVKTPEGINVKPGASIDAGDLKIGNTDGDGSAKVGTTELSKEGVGSGGTKIGNTGKLGSTNATIESEKPFHAPGLKSTAGINADGGIIAEQYIQGRTAVFTPWQGGVAAVEGIMGGIKSTADGAASAASAASSAASTAQSRADSAWTLANGRATVASVAAVQNNLDVTDSKIGTLNSQFQNLKNYVYGIHGGPTG